MKNNTNIKLCTFISSPKVDWCTFAAAIPCIEEQDLWALFICIKKYFSELNFLTQKGRRQITARAPGFYIRIIPFSLSIQIQGYHFALHDNAFNKLRIMLGEINFLINSHFHEENPHKRIIHLSRLDICRDYWNLCCDYFRDPINRKHDSTFAFKYASFSDMRLKNSCDWIDTGFLMKNSSYEIAVYRKDIENAEQKNADKKLKLVKYIGSDIPVSRLEVRLLNSNYCLFATELLFSMSNETEFCKKVLSEFYQRRKFKIKNPNDSNKDRWPENMIWKSLFIIDDQEKVNFKKETGFSKNEISFNPLMAKRNAARMANSSVDTLFKANPDNFEEAIKAQIDRSISGAKKRKELAEHKKNATEAFNNRLNKSEEPA